MFPLRIGVRGPWGPHCHRRDRATRSSGVHWSCSQETRAAETQSQAQGTGAPLNLSHPHKPTHSFLPLISRETMWAKGRKRWPWLWSGVIFFFFFSDWAAISMSLRERNVYAYHVDSDSWSGEPAYDARKTFYRGTFGRYFELCCQETQLHRWALKLMLEWVQMCDELLWPFPKEGGLCLIELISFVLLQSFLN